MIQRNIRSFDFNFQMIIGFNSNKIETFIYKMPGI